MVLLSLALLTALAPLSASLDADAQGAAAPEKHYLRLETGGHSAAVTGLAFKSEDTLLSVSLDKTIRSWTVADGSLKPGEKVLRLFTGPGSEGQLWSIDALKDGTIAVGLEGKPIREAKHPIALLNWATATPDSQIDWLEYHHTTAVMGVQFSPDGRTFISCDQGNVAIWDPATAKDKPLKGWRIEEGTVIHRCAFSTDGQRFAAEGSLVAGGGSLYVFEVANATSDKPEERAHFQQVAIPEGTSTLRWVGPRRVAVGGRSGKIYLVDVKAKGDPTVFQPKGLTVQGVPSSMAYSAALDILAVGTTGQVTLFPKASPDGTRNLAVTGTAQSLAFSPESKRLVSGNTDGTITQWNTSDFQATVSKGIGGIPHDLVWSKDSNTVGWTMGDSTSCAIDMSVPQRSASVDGLSAAAWPTAMATSPVAPAGSEHVTVTFPDGDHDFPRPATDPFFEFHTVRKDLFIARTRKNVIVYRPAADGSFPGVRLLGYEGRPSEISVSPNLKTLAIACTDQIVHLWPLDAGSTTPSLSLFASGRKEDVGSWAIWNDDTGVYTAGPGADGLIGHQVNRDPNHLASWVPASDLKSEFRKPDVLAQVASGGGQTSLPSNFRTSDVAAKDKPVVYIASVSLTDGTALPPNPDGSYTLTQVDETGAYHLKVRVRARAAHEGDPAPDLSVAVNIGSKSAIPSKVLNPGDKEFTINLVEGFNEVQVNAKGAGGDEGSSKSFAVECAGGTGKKRLPNTWVLAIGVNKYDHLDSLRFAEGDASSVADEYRSVVGKDHVRLVAKSPTRTDLFSGLDWLAQQAKPTDNVILFVSSHGYTETNAGRQVFYIAPKEFDTAKAAQTGVSWDEMLDRLTALTCRSVIVFADNCFSGGIQESVARSVESLRTRNAAVSAAADKQVIALASCQPNEESLENESWGHGAFTFCLLQALAGKDMSLPAGDLIMYDRVAAYTIFKTPALVQTKFKNRTQTPYGPVQPSARRTPISIVQGSAQ